MSSQIVILVYGRDPHLLETRRRLLELSGARVGIATDISDIVQLDPAEQIDLIVLCHSLSREQCDRAVEIAHRRWPQVQVLVLTSGDCCCHADCADQVADVSEGAAYLLETVENLVRSQDRLRC